VNYFSSDSELKFSKTGIDEVVSVAKMANISSKIESLPEVTILSYSHMFLDNYNISNMMFQDV
jgi:hypothetical protein